MPRAEIWSGVRESNPLASISSSFDRVSPLLFSARGSVHFNLFQPIVSFCDIAMTFREGPGRRFLA